MSEDDNYDYGMEDEGDYYDDYYEEEADQDQAIDEDQDMNIEQENQEQQKIVPVIQKIKVLVSEDQDVVDFLIREHKGPINLLLQQIEPLLLNKDEMQSIFLRIGKLLNQIKVLIEKMKNKDGLWQFQNKEIEEINPLIELTFRFLYIYQYSSLENFIDREQSLQLNFDKAFTMSILQILLQSDNYADSLPYLFQDNLKKIFIFCLNPSEPYIAREEGIFNNIANQLLEIMGTDPTHLVFDTLILTYFSNPLKMSTLLTHNISLINSQLESYLGTIEQALSLKEQLLVQKMIQFLIFVSQSDQKILQILVKEELYKRLYETVKFSDVSFTGSEKKQWSSDAKLIQSIVILIKIILAGKKTDDKRFAQTLLDDFLYLISQNRFNFIYSIIVPILTTNDTQYIPFCLHKAWDIDSVKLFNNYLKEISKKGTNANKILNDCRVPSDLFDDHQREYFHSAFLNTGGNQDISGIWRKIMVIDSDNSSLSIEKTLPLLENEPHTLFIFNCSYQGSYIKYGVYVKNKIESYKNNKKSIFDTSNKNLRATSNDQSFIFFMDASGMFHLKSNRMKQKQENWLPTKDSELSYLNDMKDLLRIEYQGISFLIDEEVVMYINFGNIDLSKFDIPFSQLKLEDAVVKSSKLNTEEIYLESAEIWRLEQENSNAQIDQYLQMFTQKEDLQSIYISYLKYFRLEKISIVPHYITLQSFQENFVQHDSNNKKYAQTIGSKLDDSLSLTQNIKSLEYIYDGSNSNKILDLIIPQQQANLLKLPFEEEIQKIYEVNKHGKNLTIDTFQNYCQGVTKIIFIMDKEAQNRQAWNLITFFFDAQKLLTLPNFSSHLIIQKDFFKILLSLLFTSEYSDSKIGIQNFHQAVYLLFKSLKRLFKYDKSSELRQFCFKKNILQDILNKFEIYNGTLTNKKHKTTEEKDNQSNEKNPKTEEPSISNPYCSGGSNSLSKKGVGYGQGSSDTTWMNNYSNGYSTAVSENAVPANPSYNYNINNEQINAKNKKSSAIVLGLKSNKKESKLIYNDHQTIKSYLGSEFISSILKQLSGCLEYFFDFDYTFDISLEIYQKIKQSTLNPILVKIFDTNSLLDSTKRSSFFKPIMKLFQNIAKNDELLDFFVWTEDYLEKDDKKQNKMIIEEKLSQKCLYQLLSLMKDQAEFFDKNLLQVNDEEHYKSMNLSQAQINSRMAELKNQKSIITLYLQTFDIVEKALKDNDYISFKEVEESNEDEANQLSQGNMHIEQFFTQLLKPFSVQGAPTVFKNHHYSTYFNTGTPSAVKMSRLIKEISDLTHSLPMTSQSAIFVRYDDSRMDVMKALIFGAEDTPYAHGAFVFDMFFDDTYPANSPKVNLATTGQGKIRFNPNLYHCGKVCLSLLGTWRGSSNENWNPKISTILQILVSIQAIVMSEYVFFNEPGYEGQAGTPEGDRLNRAYQNIVKIGNIRHAMIDQIKNPPPEFREVIMMSFFLKKEQILKECQKWLDTADLPADYTGLVSSHNNTFCSELSGNNYKKVLIAEINNLKKLFEGLKFNLSQSIKFQKQKKKIVSINYNKPSRLLESAENYRPKVQIQNQMQQEGQVVNVDEINIEYDEEGVKERKELNVDNADVSNRWSRYIGALGIDAVKKQANASILIIGINNIGIEIAKNMTLSGVKRLTLLDSESVNPSNIIGHFFLNEDDIKKNRATQSLKKIQALNEYVQCDAHTVIEDIFSQASPFSLQNYQTVILSNQSIDFAKKVNSICRSLNIGFILVENYSVYSRVFCDFGKSFTVTDKDGEQTSEFLIKNISKEMNGIVTLQQNVKHSLQDGDVVELKEVLSQSDGKQFNNHQFKVKYINSNQFSIGDTREFGSYQRNGIAKQIKQPIHMQFKPLQEVLLNPIFEENMIPIFTSKEITHRIVENLCFDTLGEFIKINNKMPQSWNIQDAQEFYKLSYKLFLSQKQDIDLSVAQPIILYFALTCQGYIPTQGAILGGIVSQEIVKCITKKWVPINQIFVYNNEDLLVDIDISNYIKNTNQGEIQLDSHLSNIARKYGLEIKNDKYDPIRIIFGEELLQKVASAHSFMVGAGAIGCELIKNLSMIGLGRNGMITLTDPDIIENSNLNRQFLFREKHIRQPKSSVAAAAAIYMNKDLKDKIIARLDKVYDQTEHIFNDRFFESQNIVLNALDNVQARQYMDNRCIQTRRPLIDSGTLGPKGHVQVIIPHTTETYGRQQDPSEEGDIPHCTLKMFPEQTLHCIEWARDKFGRMFSQKPQSLQRVLDAFRLNQLNTLEEKTLKEGLTILKKYPKNLDDCISYAIKKFYKLFNHNILSLLHIYPSNHVNKDGSFFWSLPKRQPNAQQFNSANEQHMMFIISCAALYANVFSLKIDQNLKSNKYRQNIIQAISKFQVPVFKIDQNKLKSMKNDVDKSNKKSEQQIQEQEIEQAKPKQTQSLDEMILEIKQICSKFNINKIQIQPQEFEKDIDDNYHVDFLHSMANCRAINYSLETMEWIDVKLKAGKIIPALVTTTSIVAGLQIIETIKILKEVKVENLKNTFLNISLPLLVQNEPQKAEEFKLTSNLTVSVWDRWEIKVTKENDNLEKLLAYLQKMYKIIPHDVFQGNKPIYIEQLMLLPSKVEEKKNILSSKLSKLLEFKSADDSFVDINVTFTQSSEDSTQLKGIPPIRLFF